MARLKYYYDTETCKYERIKISPLDVAINILGFVILSVIFSLGIVTIYDTYFPSDKEAALIKENRELTVKYDLLNREVAEASGMLAALQQKDDNVYRVIFEAEPIAPEIRNGGVGGTQKYKALLDEKLSREELVVGTFQKIDNLKRQLYIQSKSYDQLMELANNKAAMLQCMPAIQPISNKDLQKFASGFGQRIHPIYKEKRMHTGCDFAAPKGTPVYSTGDGKVTLREFSRGYGNEIEIDHGFGYVTKYAHLSEYKVHYGQKVKRGQLIGYVGSTGASVSPHLHYEVMHNGVKVNPVNYFFNDLSPEQYEKLLEIASQENQSLGF